MGEIDIEPGDTVELIDSGDKSQYELEITDGKVRFSPVPGSAVSGRQRKAGDRGIATSPRGLYAYSAEGATVKVDNAEYTLDLFGEGSLSAGERAVSAGLDYTKNSQSTIASGGGNDSVIGVSNNTDQTWYATSVSMAIEGTFTQDIAYFIVKFDSEGQVQTNIPVQSGVSYVPLDPPIRVEPDEQLNLNAQNYSAADVQIEGSIRYRENL